MTLSCPCGKTFLTQLGHDTHHYHAPLYCNGQKKKQVHTGKIHRAIVKLEALKTQGFECKAGPLENCQDYIDALELLKSMRGYHAPE